MFGFVGAPAAERRGKERELRAQVTAQLARLFGAPALSPLHQYVKDWAADPYTATEADQHMLASHPSTGLTSASEHPGRRASSGPEASATALERLSAITARSAPPSR